MLRHCNTCRVWSRAVTTSVRGVSALGPERGKSIRLVLYLRTNDSGHGRVRSSPTGQDSQLGKTTLAQMIRLQTIVEGLGVALVASFLVSCDSGGAEEYSITYTVDGTVDQANVTYTTSNGGRSSDEIYNLPFQESFETTSTSTKVLVFRLIEGQYAEGDEIVGRIYVDGEECTVGSADALSPGREIRCSFGSEEQN